MSGLLIGIGLLVWMLVGLVVVEACRLWRTWWVDPTNLIQIALWPLILFFAVKNGADQ